MWRGDFWDILSLGNNCYGCTRFMNQLRIHNAMAQFYSAKRRVTTRQIITVEATDLDPFGQGVARHNGKALFITGLLPAERAEITLTEDKRQFARGQVKRRLNDSPERVKPRCPHFGVCGGCQQQHVSVALQQESKARALGRMLSQRNGVDVAGG